MNRLKRYWPPRGNDNLGEKGRQPEDGDGSTKIHEHLDRQWGEWINQVERCSEIIKPVQHELIQDWEKVMSKKLVAGIVVRKVEGWRTELDESLRGFEDLSKGVAGLNLLEHHFKVLTKAKYFANDQGILGIKDWPCSWGDYEGPSHGDVASQLEILAQEGAPLIAAEYQSITTNSSKDAPNSSAHTVATGKKGPVPLKTRKQRLKDMQSCHQVISNMEAGLDVIWLRVVRGEFSKEDAQIVPMATAMRASLEQRLAVFPPDIVEKERQWDRLPRLELQLANLEARNFDPTWLDEQGKPLKLNAPRAPLPLSGSRFADSRSLLQPSDVTPTSASGSDVEQVTIGTGDSSAGTGNGSLATRAA